MKFGAFSMRGLGEGSFQKALDPKQGVSWAMFLQILEGDPWGQLTCWCQSNPMSVKGAINFQIWRFFNARAWRENALDPKQRVSWAMF